LILRANPTTKPARKASATRQHQNIAGLSGLRHKKQKINH